MQILPDTFLDRAEDALRAGSMPVPGDEGFSRALNESFQKVKDDLTDAFPSSGEDAPDDDAAVERALLAGAPYNPAPEHLSPFAPRAVRLTASEADALAEAMRDDGVSARALAALRDAGRMPGGATADQLIQAARQALEGKPGALGREEEALLLSLSHKAAGSGGKDVKNLFADGTPQTGLAALMAGLADSPTATTITPEEMAALAKALRLPEGTARALLDAFGNEASLTLSGREWNALLAPARAQTDLAAADTDKLLASLEKRLTPILRDAARREEMERLAGMREDKAVAQARTLIRDRATRAAPGRDATAERDEADADKQTRAAPRGEDARRAKEIAETRSLRETDAANGPAAERDAGDAELSGGRDDRAPDERPARNRDAGRAREASGDSRAAATSPGSPSTSTLYATVNQGVDTVIPPSGPLPEASGRAPLSARVLDQIEQAVLTAGKNGAHRLEVALTPEHLGSMTVVLTTRHGEVSALIQPERAETAALITRQVEQIKAQLENQGFKVEKVDVQPQLADQQEQNWQGADQHNASRDLSARVEEMDRLRRLGRSGGSSAPGAANPLAHDMHFQARTATLAGHGLHIIA